MKDDSGHWLLFAVDLKNDTIYLFDPCNEFKGSYGLVTRSRPFSGSLSLLQGPEAGPIDEPDNSKVLRNTEMIDRA